MYCWKCGNVLPNDASFCSLCGVEQPSHSIDAQEPVRLSPPRSELGSQFQNAPTFKATNWSARPLPGEAKARRLWPWFLLASVLDLVLMFVGLRPTFVVAVTGERATDWAWMIGILLFSVLVVGWLGLALYAMWRWLSKRYGRKKGSLLLASLAVSVPLVLLVAISATGGFGNSRPTADEDRDQPGEPAPATVTTFAREMATYQADPCSTYYDWAYESNQRLFRVLQLLQETPTAGAGHTFAEEITAINEFIAWMEENTWPPNIEEYERLAIEAWILQADHLTAVDDDEYDKALKIDEQRLEAEKRADVAQQSLVDRCYYRQESTDTDAPG